MHSTTTQAKVFIGISSSLSPVCYTINSVIITGIQFSANHDEAECFCTVCRNHMMRCHIKPIWFWGVFYTHYSNPFHHSLIYDGFVLCGFPTHQNRSLHEISPHSWSLLWHVFTWCFDLNRCNNNIICIFLFFSYFCSIFGLHQNWIKYRLVIMLWLFVIMNNNIYTPTLKLYNKYIFFPIVNIS